MGEARCAHISSTSSHKKIRTIKSDSFKAIHLLMTSTKSSIFIINIVLIHVIRFFSCVRFGSFLTNTKIMERNSNSYGFSLLFTEFDQLFSYQQFHRVLGTFLRRWCHSDCVDWLPPNSDLFSPFIFGGVHMTKCCYLSVID